MKSKAYNEDDMITLGVDLLTEAITLVIVSMALWILLGGSFIQAMAIVFLTQFVLGRFSKFAKESSGL